MTGHQHEEFRELCSRHGLSVTHQRQVLYETLMKMHGHPSPEAVYERVRRQIPAISLGTVYKNIKTFVDSGLVKEVSLHHGSTRIETNMEPHHHFVCEQCRSIVDLKFDAIEPVRARTRLPKGFQVRQYSVEVVGLCNECAGRRSK